MKYFIYFHFVRLVKMIKNNMFPRVAEDIKIRVISKALRVFVVLFQHFRFYEYYLRQAFNWTYKDIYPVLFSIGEKLKVQAILHD